MKIPAFRLLVSAAVLTGFATGSAATWSGAGADANWSTAANWDTTPAGSVALVFGGSTRLTNNDDLSGVTATGITFNVGAGSFVLGGNALNLGGTVVNNSNSLQTIGNALTLTAATTVNAASGDIALGGAVTGSFALTKTGSGTLTLSGGGGASRLDVQAGAVTLSGGSWSSTTAGALGLSIGFGSGQNGTLNISGGTHSFSGDGFSNSVFIGASGGTGAQNISGGTMTVGTGATGAQANGASINLGGYNAAGASNGTLTLSGTGVLNVDKRILMQNGGSTVFNNATLTIRDSATLNLTCSGATDSGVIQIGNPGNGATNTLNFDGGTLVAFGINTGAAVTANATTINFNGTQIRANASGGTFGTSASLAVMKVQAGGLLLDTNGFNTTINGTLTNGTAAGKIIKIGTGTLSLSAVTSGFTGGIDVNGGTLALTGSSTFSAGNVTVNNAGTILLFSHSDTLGDASSTPASIVTANAGTTLTNGGTFNTINTLNLNGATLTATGGASSAYQAFKLRGTVNVTGASIISSNTNTNANNAIHLGANTAGTQTTFNVIGSSDTLSVSAMLRDGVTGQVGTVVSAGLIKTGAGTLTLTAANSFTAGAAINAGTVATGNVSALGTGAVTLGGGTLSVGATGLSNLASLTLNTGRLDTSAGAVSLTGAFALAGGVWKLGASADGVVSGGAFALTAGVIDLGGLTGSVLNGTTAYSLIGGTGTSALTNANFINGNAAFAYAVDANGDLLVTSVPEPSTYGLIGAGALVAVSLVRRRKLKAV